jgi:hypothetical protein
MHVILENELQASSAAQVILYRHVAGAAASFEILVDKW